MDNAVDDAASTTADNVAVNPIAELYAASTGANRASSADNGAVAVYVNNAGADNNDIVENAAAAAAVDNLGNSANRAENAASAAAPGSVARAENAASAANQFSDAVVHAENSASNFGRQAKEAADRAARLERHAAYLDTHSSSRSNAAIAARSARDGAETARGQGKKRDLFLVVQSAAIPVTVQSCLNHKCSL